MINTAHWSFVDRLKFAWRMIAPKPFFGKRARRRNYRSPIMWPSYRTGQAQWQLIDYASLVQDGYALNAVLYAAIAYKVRQVALAPLTAYLQDWEGVVTPAPEAHPLARLLKRPNEHQTGVELMQLELVYRNISGNAYTVIVRDRPGGQPRSLHLLRPDRVYIIPITENDQAAVSYWYRPEGAPFTVDAMTPILADDVIHTKFPNPLDPLEGMGYGLSPLSPLAQSADVDNEITRFLKEFFEHGAVLPGYLTFDIEVDRQVLTELAEGFQELHGGRENWTDIAALDRGGKYIPLAMPFEQMGFQLIDERNEARILGPLGVPPILIGSRSGTAVNAYGTATRQERLRFWEDTMIPELRQVEHEFDNQLGGDNLMIASDVTNVPALVDRNVERTQAFAQLVEHGVPRDEALALVGLPPITTPLGEVSWMPANMLPYSESTPLPMPQPEEQPPPVEETRQEDETTEGHEATEEQPEVEAAVVIPDLIMKALTRDELDDALLIIDLEKTSARREKRTFDWRKVKTSWESKESFAALVPFAENALANGLNADQGRLQLQGLYS